MYKDKALEQDPNFFDLQREDLCRWHSQDPVDSLQWERSHMISEYQNNLPNPFVLDSTLAYRSYCERLSMVEKSPDPNVLIYPNPIL